MAIIMQDDPINGKVLQKRLQSNGHQVAHASNGQEVTGAISGIEISTAVQWRFSEHPLGHDARGVLTKGISECL